MGTQTFVQGFLFATGCAEPVVVDVPTNVPGNGKIWDGIKPSVWLSLSHPQIPSSFDYDSCSHVRYIFQGEKLATPFLVLYTDQHPTLTPGTIIHPVNDQVTKLKLFQIWLKAAMWGGSSVLE